MYHKIASGLLKWCLTWAHLLELIYQYRFSCHQGSGSHPSLEMGSVSAPVGKEALGVPFTTKTREKADKYTDHSDFRVCKVQLLKSKQEKWRKEAVASMGHCQSKAPYSRTWGERVLCSHRSRAEGSLIKMGLWPRLPPLSPTSLTAGNQRREPWPGIGRAPGGVFA